MENSFEWMRVLLTCEEREVILFGVLALFTLWFIRHTINYYHGEKRKLKHTYRFAKEGDIQAQKELARRYRKGDMVKKSCDKAVFWYQKVAFVGDEEAKGFLQKFFETHTKRKC